MHLILVKSVFIFGLIHFLQLFTNYTWSSVRQHVDLDCSQICKCMFCFLYEHTSFAHTYYAYTHWKIVIYWQHGQEIPWTSYLGSCRQSKYGQCQCLSLFKLAFLGLDSCRTNSELFLFWERPFKLQEIWTYMQGNMPEELFWQPPYHLSKVCDVHWLYLLPAFEVFYAIILPKLQSQGNERCLLIIRERFYGDWPITDCPVDHPTDHT